MGLLEQLGIDGFFSGFSSSAVLFWGGIILVCFIILILSGGITFIFAARKVNKLAFKNQIPIFQDINGKRIRIGLDWAKEIYVPDSNISLFYLKGFKIYLARPTRPMGKDEYWYSIAQNGEWINFDMSMDPDRNTLAHANYDHRDTRYAYINLKEIIKKNYKEKTLVWWKDPVIMNIISYIIMSLIFLGGCWFLIAKIATVVGQLGPFVERLDIIAEKLSQAVINAQNINSGMVKA